MKRWEAHNVIRRTASATPARRPTAQRLAPSGSLHSALCTPHSAFRLPPSGMTLVELLVVIVILTTLVGGVLPLISPNNEARKIREASRGLQTYLTQAQAEAARSGRPVGIGIRESAAGSGVALEVFQMEVPPAFAGFSETSRVRIPPVAGGRIEPVTTYGSPGNGGTLFVDQYQGFPVYNLQFVIPPVIPGNITDDPLPPRMFRVGDTIDVEGFQFMIVDDDAPLAPPNEVDTDNYRTGYLGQTVNVHAVWTNPDFQSLQPPQGPRRYKIFRQPNTPGIQGGELRINSEPPFQLPAGIAIDFLATGFENNNGLTVVSDALASFNMRQPPPLTAGFMFSPNGALESVWVNGQRTQNFSRAFLLVGRVENGNPDNWIIPSGASDEQLAELQEEVNWLNLDSHWLMLGGRSGRIAVAENAFVGPQTDAQYPGVLENNDPQRARRVQIRAAQRLARDMQGVGGS